MSLCYHTLVHAKYSLEVNDSFGIVDGAAKLWFIDRSELRVTCSLQSGHFMYLPTMMFIGAPGTVMALVSLKLPMATSTTVGGFTAFL